MYFSPQIIISHGPVGTGQTIHDGCKLLAWRGCSRTAADVRGGDEALLRSSDGTKFFGLRKWKEGITVHETVDEISPSEAADLLETIKGTSARFIFVTEVTDPLPE